MSGSSYTDNGSPVHVFPIISKEYEQYNNQEQYFPVQQQNLMGNSNSNYLYHFPNQQQVPNQNNFPVPINPVMSQQPRFYPFENQVMPYVPPMQNGQFPYEDLPVVSPASDNANKPKPAVAKRLRTQYSSEQLIQLEDEFNKKNYLNRPSRFRLSQALGLTEKQIKVWFQNRRMKKKKEYPGPSDRIVSSSLGSSRSSASSAEFLNGFQVPGNMQLSQQSPINNSTYSPNLEFQQSVPEQNDSSFPTSTNESINRSDLYMPQAIVNSAQTEDELLKPPTIMLDNSFDMSALAESEICGNLQPLIDLMLSENDFLPF